MRQTITEKIFSEHAGEAVFAGQIIESAIDMVIAARKSLPTRTALRS